MPQLEQGWESTVVDLEATHMPSGPHSTPFRDPKRFVDARRLWQLDLAASDQWSPPSVVRRSALLGYSKAHPCWESVKESCFTPPEPGNP